MTQCIKAMTEAPANKPQFYVTDEDITRLSSFKWVLAASQRQRTLDKAVL
jgi:hypothetical protein